MSPDSPDSISFNLKKRFRARLRFGWCASVLSLSVLVLIFLSLLSISFQPPTSFSSGHSLIIEPGQSLRDIVASVKAEGLVRSELLLYIILSQAHNPRAIQAGTYYFPTPLNVFAVARELAEGEARPELVRLTVHEGVTAAAISRLAADRLIDFDAAEFITLAESKEGYLFPDTYFVPFDYSPSELLELLLSTGRERLAPLRAAIAEHEFTEYEILILASLLEREANNEESKRLVSGIFQNRLAIGMALQADASLEYVLDKSLSELTAGDLSLDSPYNTYLYPGLMPTPIGNPGLEAIKAVLEPTPSDYFYYITGNDGVFYYARTYDEHLSNIERHLR